MYEIDTWSTPLTSGSSCPLSAVTVSVGTPLQPAHEGSIA
jgi:hypothetical protein